MISASSIFPVLSILTDVKNILCFARSSKRRAKEWSGIIGRHSGTVARVDLRSCIGVPEHAGEAEKVSGIFRLSAKPFC
jgi:hypothetical protein